jgi:hypothetical protein
MSMMNWTTWVFVVRLLLIRLSEDYFSPEAALQENVPSIGIFVVVDEIMPVAGMLVCHGLQAIADGSHVEQSIWHVSLIVPDHQESTPIERVVSVACGFVRQVCHVSENKLLWFPLFLDNAPVVASPLKSTAEEVCHTFGGNVEDCGYFEGCGFSCGWTEPTDYVSQ